MIDTEKAAPPQARPRGRPRAFCENAALDVAERLFAQEGYEAVSVAALCEAMGIRPPSFYAAFGSKAQLFARVVDRYAAGRGGAVLRAAMEAQPDPRRGLPRMLLDAADAYADGSLGCLVMEAGTGEGALACEEARARTRAALTDYAGARAAGLIVVALTGLSGAARNGASRGELKAFAKLAADGIAQWLGRDQ